jgi:hypothetical protein
VRGERQQRGGARERGAAQQRADVAPEAAAGDQHQPLGALGELVEELHRHATAERVSDDRRALDAEHRQQVADAGRVCPERVVTAGGRGVTMADQVGRDHRIAVGQRERHRAPVARGVEHAVDQHDRRPAAGHVVDHAMAVQLHLPGLELVDTGGGRELVGCDVLVGPGVLAAVPAGLDRAALAGVDGVRFGARLRTHRRLPAQAYAAGQRHRARVSDSPPRAV